MNIAIIDAFHQFHFETIFHLKKRLNPEFNIVYILKGPSETLHGNKITITEILDIFEKENCIIDSITEFLYYENICKNILEPYVLSESLLLRLKPVESLALRLMDRNSLKTISVFKRKLIYLLLVNYFYNLILSHKIDVCLTFDTPHSTHSVILYELLRVLNKKVIRLENHMLPNFSLILPSFDIPEIPKIYWNENNQGHNIIPTIDSSIENVLEVQNKYLEDFKSKETKRLVNNNTLGNVKIILRGFAKVGTNLIQGTLPFLFKKEILHFSSLDEIQNRFIYRLNLTPSVYKLVKYNLYYNKIAIVPNLDKKYIFFGMHMQPEKTSQPLGLDFDNQLKAIWMLSQALPDGWKLLVKEHPNQFNLRKAPNANYRNMSFYKMLQSIPNIEIVQLFVPSEDLTVNAQIVSTLTGTLGWEGLLQGKPVIAFGDAYYKPCRAVESPDSLEECKESIKKLTALSSEQIRIYLYQYLKYYYDQGYLVKAPNWESKFKFSTEDRSKHIEALSDTFVFFLKKFDS